MTGIDIVSALPPDRQKCAEIALCDAHNTAETVGDEITALDPPVNRTGAHVEALGHLWNAEEFVSLTPKTARRSVSGSSGGTRSIGGVHA
jgi:hypothetical protein